MIQDDFNKLVLKNKAELVLKTVKENELKKKGFKFVQIDRWTKVFRKT